MNSSRSLDQENKPAPAPVPREIEKSFLQREYRIQVLIFSVSQTITTHTSVEGIELNHIHLLVSQKEVDDVTLNMGKFLQRNLDRENSVGKSGYISKKE
jgi:hypothetical protein